MMRHCFNSYKELWGLFFVDRLAKLLAWRFLQTPVDITPFLGLELHFNKGVSWSLFAGSGWWGNVLIILASGSLLCFFAWYIHQRRLQGYCTRGEVLVLVGGTSNFLDRIRYGAVVDYIHVHWGAWSYPVFNIADILIVIGVVYMIWQPSHES